MSTAHFKIIVIQVLNWKQGKQKASERTWDTPKVPLQVLRQIKKTAPLSWWALLCLKKFLWAHLVNNPAQLTEVALIRDSPFSFALNYSSFLSFALFLILSFFLRPFLSFALLDSQFLCECQKEWKQNGRFKIVEYKKDELRKGENSENKK